MSMFWRNWLNVWCVGVALFGLVLAGGAFDATNAPIRQLYAALMPAGKLALDAQMRMDLDADLRFTMAVLGAVSMGWAGTMWAVIQAALALQRFDEAAAQRVWTLALASFFFWFVSDSILSVATGFWRNVIPNAILMAGLLAPLIASGVIGRPVQLKRQSV